MANSKKFIVKNGLLTQNVAFVSPDEVSTINVSMLNSDTLSVSGNSGQLFSITDSLTGTIFAVNDISGVPSIEIFDTGKIQFAETFGNVLIGTATDNTVDKLQINGSLTATQLKSTIATGTAPLTVTSTTAVANLNADLLDGNHASAFYLASNPTGYTTNTGTVTSVAALTLGTTGTDVSSTVATGTTTPVITLNIPTASATNRGALSAADWTTFNNKTSNTGTVTSVSMTVPTGLTIGGSPITTSGTLALTLTAGYSIPTTTSQTNWDTAYTDRNKWDGGATGLVAATGRTSLGGTTIGQNVFTLVNPTAITFPRFNADNTVSALDAATFRTAIGAGTSSTVGTVTSVGGTGAVSGLTLSGTVTSTGNLTLGGTLAVTASNFASQATNTVLAAPNGTAGVPTFRVLAAGDIPGLDASKITTGVFDAARLPSYVDDVLEYANLAAFPATGTAGIIYIALDTNKAYRWSGTVYVYITSGAVDSVGGYTGVVTSANLLASMLTVDGSTSGLDADLLDGNHASAFYLATNPSGYTTNTGTVTSVGGTGTVSGLSLSGTVTTTGNLTLSGTLAVTPSNFASQTANTFLAAPNGSTGVPVFRTIVAADVPTLNQNTTGSAGSIVNTVAGTNTVELVHGNMADSDQFRILVGGTATNAGYVEIATADDGTEPIYVRQYTGAFATVARTATLLDGSGNTSFPGTVTSNGTTLTGNVGTVTSVAALTLGTTGTDISSTVATGTTTPVITLNIPTASATNRGALSAADWTTFNNKQPAGAYLTSAVTTVSFGTTGLTPSTATSGAVTVAGTLAVANGGTGATTAAGALTILGAYAATNPSGYTTNTGTVTSVIAGTGLSGGTISTSGTISLSNTAVTAGSYTLASITVDAQGRITAASNGTGGGAEADTLATVTGRGATTTTAISLTNSTTSTTTSTGALVVTGGVGIGGSAYVGGSLYAASKSFLIDHPTKEGMKLQYGSLESPYHGVRLTGEAVISGDTVTINLPDYIHGLCKQEGSQVQITNIKHGKVLWVEDIDIETDCFVVGMDRGMFDSKDYKFYWSFTAVRKDVADIVVEFEV